MEQCDSMNESNLYDISDKKVKLIISAVNTIKLNVKEEQCKTLEFT